MGGKHLGDFPWTQDLKRTKIRNNYWLFQCILWFQTRLHRRLSGKESACHAGAGETQVLSPGAEDPLEEEKAAHFSLLAWRIPWTVGSGGLQSVGLQSQT